MIVYKCYKVSYTVSGGNSVWATHINKNKFEGSEFLMIDGKCFLTCFSLTHISHLEVKSEEALGKRFRIIIFLDRFRVYMTYYSMPNITRFNFQRNWGKNFIIEEFTILSLKRPSLTKHFPMNTLFLEITNLLYSLTILYLALRRWDSLIRFF